MVSCYYYISICSLLIGGGLIRVKQGKNWTGFLFLVLKEGMVDR